METMSIISSEAIPEVPSDPESGHYTLVSLRELKRYK